MSVILLNSAEGGTNAVAPTAGSVGNTGGASGNFLDTVTVSGTGATVTFSNTTTAHGGLSYKFASTTSQASNMIWRSSGSLPATQTTGYARLSLNLSSLVAIGRIMQFTDTAIAVQGGVGITAAGKITLTNSAGTITNTSTTGITANTWFRLEMFMTSSATAGQVICRIFTDVNSNTPTETLTSATTLNTRGGNIGALVFGFPFSVTTTATIYMDDLGYSTDNWLGAVPVPALVQSVKGNGGGYVPNWSLAIPNPVTAGNLLVMTLAADAATTVTSVTDNVGNTWTLAAASTGTNRKSRIYFVGNAKAGATTVTLTTGAANDTIMNIREYSGVATASPLDQVITASDGAYAAAHTSGTTAATTQAFELVVATFSGDDSTAVWTAGTGYGNAASQSGFDAFMTGGTEDKIVSVTGTQTATMSSGAAFVLGDSAVATFKAAAASSNLAKTQPALARIARTVTKTQAATSRIAKTVTKTQGATATIAQAAAVPYIKTGTFTGNATAGRAITGLGFQPDLVLVKNISQSFDTWFKTKDMAATQSFPIRSDTSSDTNHITALSADGFTVSADAAVNGNTDTMEYLAVKDNGAGILSTFTFTGDATDGKSIALPFKPDFALIKSDFGIVGAEKFAGEGVDGSTYVTANAVSAMNYQGGGERADLIMFAPTGLLLGNGDLNGGNLVNQAATAHFGFAFKSKTGLVSAFSYTGNGTLNSPITTPGFQPTFLNLHRADGGSPTQLYAPMAANTVTNGWDNTGNWTNMVTSLTSTGFTLGTDPNLNNTGSTFYGLALAASAPAGGSSTLTKTQTATARVAVTKTLTQPATARLVQSSVLTKTQSAVARLSQTFTKTQTATARILPTSTVSKTQTATARVAANRTKTQPATARTAATRTRTQGATARIAQILPYFPFFDGFESGAVDTNWSVTAGTPTIDTVTKFSGSNSANFTTTAATSVLTRFKFPLVNAAVGYASFWFYATTNPSASTQIARFRNSTGNLIVGLKVATNGEIVGKQANSADAGSLGFLTVGWNYIEFYYDSVSATTWGRLNNGPASYWTNTTNDQWQRFDIGIVNAATWSVNFDDVRLSEGVQIAFARIANTRTRTQSATANILAANAGVKSQPATARIATTVTKTQPAVSRIAKTLTKTQPALARLAQTYLRTQPATSRVARILTKTQGSTARVARTQAKTQGATATVVQAVLSTKTQPTLARIAVTRTTSQAAIARVSATRTKLQTATAAVGKTFTKTQTATAKVVKSFSKTQTATAAIIRALTLTKTQSATAYIVQNPLAHTVITLDLVSPDPITLSLTTTIVTELLVQTPVSLALPSNPPLTLSLDTNIINLDLRQAEVLQIGLE